MKKKLNKCNLEMAKGIIMKEFAGGAIPKDLAHLLDQYVSNPSIDSALELIKYDPKFLSIFELSRKGGFTEHLFSEGDIK